MAEDMLERGWDWCPHPVKSVEIVKGEGGAVVAGFCRQCRAALLPDDVTKAVTFRVGDPEEGPRDE